MSFSILWVLCRHLTSLMSLMLCRWVPVMFWAVLIICCRTFLSWALHTVFPVNSSQENWAFLCWPAPAVPTLRASPCSSVGEGRIKSVSLYFKFFPSLHHGSYSHFNQRSLYLPTIDGQTLISTSHISQPSPQVRRILSCGPHESSPLYQALILPHWLSHSEKATPPCHCGWANIK